MTKAQTVTVAELSAMTAKAREAIALVPLPDSDVAWKEYKGEILNACAWLDYFAAKAACPDADLSGATLAVQYRAAMGDALEQDKVVYSHPEIKAQVERVQKIAYLFAKGLVVLVNETAKEEAAT